MKTKIFFIVICAGLIFYVSKAIGNPNNNFDSYAGLSIVLLGLAAIIFGLGRSIYKKLSAK